LVVNVVKGGSPAVSDTIKIVKILRNTDSDSGSFSPIIIIIIYTNESLRSSDRTVLRVDLQARPRNDVAFV